MAETKAKTFLSLFLLLLLLLSTAASKSNNTTTDFIRQNCLKTLYPSLCFSSLAPFATAVQQNPVKLAFAAANVSLSKIHDASSLADSFRRISGAGRVSAALRDCVETLGAAADLTNRSAGEITKLGDASKTGGNGEIAWEVSNAQTWMSAAMTNEETCLDGFDGVRAGKGVRAMCDRVGGVKKYTSNALALLNTLVHGS